MLTRSLSCKCKFRCIFNSRRYLDNESIFNQSLRTPKPKDAKFAEEDEYLLKAEGVEASEGKEIVFHAKIQWPNVAVNMFIHFGSLVGFYHMFMLQPKWQTYVWCECC